MNTTPQKTMLYINSLFSSKEYNLNTKDQLRISEASPTSQKSEVIPLDMLEATPVTLDKVDPQLLAFTIVCGLASGIFFIIALRTGLTITSVFSAIFLLVTLTSLYMAFNKKIRSYTYHYANTNTPLFTLSGNKTNSTEITKFVETLTESIQTSTIKEGAETDTQQDIPFEKSEATEPTNEEQEYLTYSYHLDYLYKSGLVDEPSYRRIGQNITNRIFGREPQETTSTNIINFPH